MDTKVELGDEDVQSVHSRDLSGPELLVKNV